MEKLNHIVVAAGGTGGHVYPALTLVDVFRKQGCSISWVGRSYGLEKEVCKRHDIEMIPIDVAAVRGKRFKIFKLFRLFLASFHLVKMFWKTRPKAIIIMGGYVGLPAGIAAYILRIPLIIHEQKQLMTGSTDTQHHNGESKGQKNAVILCNR